MGNRSIYIGYDPREVSAFAVAGYSLLNHLYWRTPIKGLVLSNLIKKGLYQRPMEDNGKSGMLYDVLSKREDYNGAMSTEFALSRFFVTHLSHSGWVLFADCDVLFRADASELFRIAESTNYAVMCVKHDHKPTDKIKMDGQQQTVYKCKNWSSLMMINCDHPKNKDGLSLETLNSVPGIYLHTFGWLDHDQDIGELNPRWNWLADYSSSDIDPAMVHYTEGGPWFANYKNAPFADEWVAVHNDWVTNGFVV